LKVTAPRLGILGCQFGSLQSFSQFAPCADLLVIGHKPGDGHAVLDKHKSHVLVVSAVDAIGEVPRRFGDADGGLFHKIRLSDSKVLVNPTL